MIRILPGTFHDIRHIGWLVLLLVSCAGPVQRQQEQAAQLGLVAAEQRGLMFDHVTWSRAGTGPRLHVYLDGDGQAWRGARPARQPDTRRSLMLEAMALDPAPVLFVGRPCYHGLARRAPCQPLWWTHWRYAESVVASLAAVIERAAAGRELLLFGHSGGGSLAMLLAARLPRVVAVVTAAGNLDVAGWTQHHGYTALQGLDPASEPPLPAQIVQRHWVGLADAQVPASLTRRFLAARGQQAALREVADIDHACCWVQLWPQVLAELPSASPDAPAMPPP